MVWLALGSPTRRADNWIYDTLLGLSPGRASEQVVVVAIDNRSIEALGRWPWSRTLHARAVDRLTEAGAASIGYDVLFAEPEPGADDALIGALSRNRLTWLAELLQEPGENGAPYAVVEPTPELAVAAAGLGHVDLTPDPDGVVRRLPLFMSAGPELWPHMTARMRTATGGALPAPRVTTTPWLTPLNPTLIRYRGPPGSVRTVSFVDLVRGETPAAFLKDKSVLIGMTADGLGDRFATPVSPHGQLRPGVEIQAALLDTLIQGDALRAAPPALLAFLSLIPLWALMAAFLMLRPAISLAAGVGTIATVFLVSALAFLAGVWLAPVAAVVGVALAWPLWSWRRLEAASAYMQAEIDAFRSDGPWLADIAASHASGDHIDRQATVLKAALLRLRDLSGLISDTLHSLPDATLVIDDTGRVLLANARAAALFEQDGVLAGADIDTLFARIGAEPLESLLARTGAAREIRMATGEVLKLDEARLELAQGSRPGGIVRLADVTAIRVAERQREQALQLLSHDMRSPQVSILTLLADHAPRDEDFEHRIGEYARRTLAMAESYVQLARAESQVMDRREFDLGQALIEAADNLWPQAQTRGVTVLTPDDGEERLVVGDPVLVSRALVNLIDNALKYGPRGGDVTCTLETMEIAGRRCHLCTVRDQGPGFPAEEAERLFDAFHQAADARPGVGLGLAFVRIVAERHGGSVSAASPPGEGARFTLTLPDAG
ncbi:CHASE2 and HATPase_c domain-containing protein [Brevundimonas goettingensis]|uniref:CHASE2 and HATPase_c domain-containing protein n=1 Tax=Brevundimonas goettingensis TaxID=2774190 RepID=UPI001CEDD645|nr:CHASE2 and HATPase_c domain-containing protein [Brevundimonas goettingensis]